MGMLIELLGLLTFSLFAAVGCWFYSNKATKQVMISVASSNGCCECFCSTCYPLTEFASDYLE